MMTLNLHLKNSQKLKRNFGTKGIARDSNSLVNTLDNFGFNFSFPVALQRFLGQL